MAVRVLVAFYLLLVTFTPLNGLSTNVSLCQTLTTEGGNIISLDYGPESKEGVIYSPAYLPDLSSLDNSRGCYFILSNIPGNVYVDVLVRDEPDHQCNYRRGFYLTSQLPTGWQLLTTGPSGKFVEINYISPSRGYLNINFAIRKDEVERSRRFTIDYSVLPLFTFPIDNGTTINTTTHPKGYLSTRTSMNSTAPTPGLYEITLNHQQHMNLAIKWSHVELGPVDYLLVVVKNSTDQSQKCNSTANCPTHTCNSKCTVTIQLIVGASDDYVKDVLLHYTADDTMTTDSAHVTPPNISSTSLENTESFSSNETTKNVFFTTEPNTGGFDFLSNTAAIIGVAVGSSIFLVILVTAIICVVVRRTSMTRCWGEPSKKNDEGSRERVGERTMYDTTETSGDGEYMEIEELDSPIPDPPGVSMSLHRGSSTYVEYKGPDKVY